MRLFLLIFSFYFASMHTYSIPPTLESIMERLEPLETELKETKTFMKNELEEINEAIKKIESVQLVHSLTLSSESEEVTVSFEEKLNQLNSSLTQQLEQLMKKIETDKLSATPTTTSDPTTPMNTTTTPTTTVVSYTHLLDLRSDPCMPPIKNQGKCTGGEWAFAVMTTLEFNHCRKHNNQLTLFSEQQLLDCVSKNPGCRSGSSFKAFDYLGEKDVWISSSASYPLTSDQTGSAGTCQQGDKSALYASWDWVTGSASKTPNVSQIIDALNEYGPIPVVINVDVKLLSSYTGGIYSDDNCVYYDNKYRHYVIVGYGQDSSGTDYWIVRGSYGTDWGVNGYMYIKRGIDFCNIEWLPQYATIH